MGNRSSSSLDTSTPPKVIKSFSSWFSSSPSTFVSGFASDSTNRLLLAGWSTAPRYVFYDLETLEQVGFYNSNESDHKRVFSCLFLSDTVCAVSSSHQLEIFSFKREDPPKEKKEEKKGESIKLSDFTHIKILPLDPSVSANPQNHTIVSLNSVSMSNNNNNSAQLVLAPHRESCLSFWRTPNKNQLDRSYQYHQVGFLDLVKTYNFPAKNCRVKFLTSSCSSSSRTENYAHFVCTYLSGFCLFKVSWCEKELYQREEVNIELVRKIELSHSVGQFGFSYIDVARNFVVVHAGRGDDAVGYLYDLNNFRVVSELKTSTRIDNDLPTIIISEDADVVVVGTYAGNIHFFSQASNWNEVLFQQVKPIEFGDGVYDLHLCSERQLVISGGLSRSGLKSTPMKIFHAPLLRSRWKRRRIVFLLQCFCGFRKTKQMLDMYRVRQCIALFL